MDKKEIRMAHENPALKEVYKVFIQKNQKIGSS